VRPLAAAAVLVALLGCAHTPPPPPASDEAGRMGYAHQLFDEGDYAKAVLVLQELISNRPGSRYVEEATYLIGRAYYEQGMDVEAEDQFRQYLRSFRGGNFEPEAQYYLGLALLSQSRSPMLDQTETKAALGEFQSFLARFPDHELAERAKGHIATIRAKLAEKEYLNGKLYLKRGYQKAARFYFLEKVLDPYSDTPWACPAMLALGQSYEKTLDWSEAANWAQHYLATCPAGDDVAEARDILKQASEMGASGEAPDTSAAAEPADGVPER
jgi:outer membrane protein assembly factor BamD